MRFLPLVLMIAAADARASDAFDGYAFYFGDLHVHTGASNDGGATDIGNCTPGGCGAIADLRTTAQTNGLDFLGFADHVNGSTTRAPAARWALVQAFALENDDPDGGFVTIPGAELMLMTSSSKIGHKTMLFFGDDATLASLTEAAEQPNGGDLTIPSCEWLWQWATSLETTYGPVLLLPHHPALQAPMPTDWSCYDAHFSPAVEVYSEHGSSEGGESTFDPPWSPYVSSGSVDWALDPSGPDLELGFFGGTDSHDTKPGSVCDKDVMQTQFPYGGGLTVAVLPEGERFDRSAIHDALVARHTYETSGPLMPVVASYGSGGAYLGGMGDELAVPEGQPLDAEVLVPEAWDGYVLDVELVTPSGTVEMGRGARGEWTAQIPADDRPAWVYPRLTVDGGNYYGLGGCDDGGDSGDETIWISPSFLKTGPPDVDDDGWTWASGDCDDGDPDVHPQACEVCDDGADQDCDRLVDADDPDCGPPGDPPGRGGDTDTDGWDLARPDGEAPGARTSGVGHAVGCDSVGGAFGWALALALLVRRRR